MGVLRSIGEKKTTPRKNNGDHLGFVVKSAAAGVGSTLEGAVDLVEAGGHLLIGDTEGAKNQFKDNVVGDWYQKEREKYNPSGVTGFIGDVAHGIGNSSIFLLDAVAPGLGTTLFFAGAAGGGISSAAEKTGDVGWKEFGYGVASGVLEGGLEKLTGAGSKAAKSVGSAIAKKTGKSASAAIAKQAGKTFGKTVLKETVKGMAGEFVEEAASELIDPGLQRLFNIDENASTSLNDVLYAGLVGAVSGGVMTGSASAINYKSAERAGRKIREAGETEATINRAKATVEVLKKVTDKAATDAKTEVTLTEDMSGFAKTVAKAKQRHENSKIRKEGKRSAELTEMLEKNIQGFESLTEDVRNSAAGDALLGELRGNLYYTKLAYSIETEADELLKYTAEQQQEIVDYINREAAKIEGQRADYTVEDFAADTDGIRTQFAALEIGEVVINGVPTEEKAKATKTTVGSDVEAGAKTAEAAKTAMAGAAGAAGVNTASGANVGARINTTAGADASADAKATMAGQGGRASGVYTITEGMSPREIMDAVADSWGLGEVERHMMHDTYTEDSALSPEDFAGAWADGVNIGRNNMDPGGIDPDGRLAAMSERERANAIEAGRIAGDIDKAARAREAEQKKAPPRLARSSAGFRRQGSEYVHLENGVEMRSLSDRQYAAVKVAGVVGEALDVDIYFHKTLGGDNGVYDPETNTIHIALDAGMDGKGVALFTLAHEVTHHIYEWSPAKFEALSDFCMSKLGKDAKDMIDKKLEKLDENGLLKNMTYREALELAREEVVADAMEDVLTDGEVIGDLVTHDESLWEKVKAWIIRAIGKIRAAYKGLKPESNAGRAMAEFMHEEGAISELERIFSEGVKDAGARKRAAETLTSMNSENVQVSGEKKHSIKKTSQIPYSRQLRDIEDGVMNGSNSLYIGKIANLQKVGFSDAPFAMNQGDYRKSRRQTAHNKNYSSHAVEYAFFEKMPGYLADAPMFICKGDKITIITDYPATDTKGKPSFEIAGVWQNQKMEDDTVNQVKSVYPLDEIANKIQTAADEGRLVITNKSKAEEMLASIGIQTSKQSNILSLARDSITQTSPVVNTEDKKSLKFSLGSNGEQSEAGQKAKKDKPVDVVGQKAGAAYKEIDAWVNEAFSGDYSDGSSDDAGLSSTAKWTIRKGIAEAFSSVDRTATARKLAESILENVMITKYADPDAFDRYTRIYEVLGEYRKSLKLDGLREDLQHMEDDEWRTVYNRWNSDEVTARSPDAVKQEIEERLGETMEMDHPADILDWIDGEYVQARKKLRDMRTSAKKLILDEEEYTRRRAELATIIQDKMADASYDVLAEDSTKFYREAYNAAVRKANEYLRGREDTLKETYRQKEQYKDERREAVTRQAQARRLMARLNTMLFSPTKSKHLPSGMQQAVEEILGDVDIGAFGQIKTHMAKLATLEREIGKLEAIPVEARSAVQNKRLDDMRYKRDMMATEQYTAREQAKHLLEIYKAFGKSKDKLTLEAYDAEIAEALEQDLKAVEKKPLASMSLESLKAVEKIFGVIYRSAVRSNQILSEETSARISDMGDAAVKEVEDAKAPKFLKNKQFSLQTADDVRAFFWRNSKPLTVFNLIGSDSFKKLFVKVLEGEEIWARDILEARDFVEEAKKKHKYDEWDLETRLEVKVKDGKTVKLTRGEIMSLYAYSFRKQAIGHLEGGGFVMDPMAVQKAIIKGKNASWIKQKLNDAERYTLDAESMGNIAKMLTEEQKQYVTEVQRYLSDVMGEKGNEVSRKLWGLDLFREEFYFPIKVKGEYLESQTGKTGDPKIKNKGLAHETVPDADNPLVLQDFMTVVCGHINDMSAYHSFVLPVEDLTRVLNYKPSNATVDEDGNFVEADDATTKNYSSLKSVIESKYGKVAVEYVEQLLRDLNGGARREMATGIIDKGITAFKKASTMASLSVLIQQPTSIFRAMAYIDPKYLFTVKRFSKGKHKERWELVKKYAPVAIIKEMGGYDTGTGMRTASYINAPEYNGFTEKAKAFFKDADYRGEILGKGASLADEITWVQIFEACVQEQADKLGKPDTSEEVLQAAGARFTEVIRSTQVYDSTLSRSQLMRSKDTGMKMVTSFMAEPTTVVSMIIDAIVAGERGDKKLVRMTVAGVLASIIVNALAVSLVYAMRDDDEEKTYEEKLLANVAAETAEGLNPLEYLPIARDIMSLVKGYEVERSDMSLFASLIQSVQRLTSGSRSPYDKVVGVAGAAGSFFGLPIKNIERDAKGLVLTTMGIFKESSEKTTKTGMEQAVSEEFSYITKLFGAEYSNAYELYRATVNGDTAHYERVAARYDSASDAEMALRKMLREHDPRIAEAAEARYSGEIEVYTSIVDQIEAEGIFDRNMVIKAINNELNRIRETENQVTVPVDEEAADVEEAPEALYSSFDLNQAIDAGDAENVAIIIEEMVSERVSQGKTEAQAKAAIKSSVTSYWKKLYVEAWRNGDTEERKRIIKLLTDTGLYGDRNDVAKKVTEWVQSSSK